MDFESYRKAVHERVRPLENAYLVALRDGTLTREDFLETQVQFLFAVVFFSRPMAALAGRLPRPAMRVPLLANVADEHGEGNLRFSHEATFLEFLSRFGETPSTIEPRALWPEVRAFNATLTASCVLDDVFTGVAVLGMIEDIFAHVSGAIGSAVVARGWLTREALVHYTTHEKLDVEHAEGFYRLLREPYANHPRYAYQVQQGLELGAYMFVRLYEDLYRSRARRWSRPVGGPHSLSEGWYLET